MLHPRMIGILEQIRGKIETDESVVPETKYGSVDEAFFDFMDRLVDPLRMTYEMTEDEAFNFIARVADQLAAKGILPPFPSDSSSDPEVAKWLHAANISEIARYVDRAARLRALEV